MTLKSKPFEKLLKEPDYLEKALYHQHRAIEFMHKHEKGMREKEYKGDKNGTPK